MPTTSSSPTKSTWGGKREGAGRKPAPGSFGKGHHARAPHDPRRPLEVILRVRPDVGLLPRAAIREAMLRADAILEDRADFRLLQFAVQRSTLHFIVEARSTDALTAGMHSLTIVVARAINRALDRTGKVFAHRFYASQP